jgi:hypothetical protein
MTSRPWPRLTPLAAETSLAAGTSLAALGRTCDVLPARRSLASLDSTSQERDE